MWASNAEYVIRPAGVDDAHVIARQRASMFLDMGSVSAEESEVLRKACEPWLVELLTSGSYIGFLALQGDKIVAGGGILLAGSRSPSWLPSHRPVGAPCQYLHRACPPASWPRPPFDELSSRLVPLERHRPHYAYGLRRRPSALRIPRIRAHFRYEARGVIVFPALTKCSDYRTLQASLQTRAACKSGT